MGLVANPMQPNDVLELIPFEVDERIATRMREISAAILSEGFSGDDRSGGQAEVLACTMQTLAFLGCPVDKAVATAHDVAKLMRGETGGVSDLAHHRWFNFEQDEAEDEYGHVITMWTGGGRVATFEYVGTEMVDIDADWGALNEIASAVLAAGSFDRPTTPEKSMSDDPYAHRRFGRIETTARMPDGSMRTSWRSYPLGVGKDEYDRIDAALVRAFGRDGTRTTGMFFEDMSSALKSDRTRRDGLMPVPCIVCGTELDSAANDPSFDHVPHAGTMFHSGGHYGSGLFDSFDGFRLQIVVCDACLESHAKARVRLVDPKGAMSMWDGETDGYEPGTPGYEERMREQEARLRDAGMVLIPIGTDGF